MDTPVSFDIAFLGLKDPSAAGRSRMILAIERLTGRSTADCQAYLSRVGLTIFDSLPVDQAQLVVSALDEAGVVCEVRPKEEVARSVGDGLGGGMMACPSCGFVQHAGPDECSRCGVIFSKREKDEVRKMQSDRALEEAVQRAEQIRREWDERARAIVDARPLPDDATAIFTPVLNREEIPFLLLQAAEGPLLMTSRQVLAAVEGSFVQMPYEVIKDVDFGGGLVVKKGHTRLVFHFHVPVPVKDKSATSCSWQLTASAATNKETILDWAFARSYMCGSCGARDLDYRSDKGTNRARCMHCATDHIIDLRSNSIRALLSS
ncbi:MAG: hypothetical protein MUC56_00545 [Thermoanaerobaculales bacterium]|jgi:DNA-directed RNA polymerase subunit RPC12/RpoP|nr:hypothetical protein [Thermoanaerobaculales bacterium]